MKNTVPRVTPFEKFVIVVAMSIGLTFLPNILFPGWRFAKYFGIIFLIGAALALSRSGIKLRVMMLQLPLIFTLTIVFVLESAFAVRALGSTSVRAIVLLATHLVFVFFLLKVFSRLLAKVSVEQAVVMILRPYFFLCVFIVFSSIVVLALIVTGFVDVGTYPIPPILGYEFNNRLEEIGVLSSGLQELSFPLYVTVIGNYSRIIPIPTVMLGWSYEPHVATLFLTPAFLMASLFVNNLLLRLFFYLAFALFVISAGSMTNLTGLLLCVSALVMRQIFSNRLSKLLFLVPFIVFALLVAFGDFVFDVVEGIFDLINAKILNPTGSSFETTNFYWQNLFSSNGFIGNGFLFVPVLGGDNPDPGLVSAFFVFFLFLALFVIFILLFFQDGRVSTLLSIVFLYLFVHSYKFPVFIVNYPFYTFFVVLALLILGKRKLQG